MLKQMMMTLLVLFLAVVSGSAQVLSPVYNFSDTNDLTTAAGGLLLSNNTLYGTIFGGVDSGGRDGAESGGVVFKLNKDGTGFTNLYIFSAIGSRLSPTNTDGANPPGPVVLSGNKLYGTTENGGFYAVGTVFAINTDGTGFTNLHNFNASDANDGATPSSGLVLSGNKLYGTTSAGGSFGGGTVFAINIDGTGFTNLYNFSAVSGSNDTNSDGYGDKSSLILFNNTLYGTASRGGSADRGTVFAVNTDGTGFTNLHSFSDLVHMTTPPYVYTNTDGVDPGGGLVLLGNTLYGTAAEGGSNTNNAINAGGTVFAININGTGFTTLHSFGGSDGVTPEGLVLSGNTLYGTAYEGGSLGEGTVFALNTNGTGFATLDTFTPISSGTNAGGTLPIGNMVASGSALYGVAQEGGTNGDGIVFALNLAVAPPTIQFTANPTNVITRLAVQFNSPAVDGGGNGIVSWNWNFGDGSNSVSSVQNPTHAYTNAATFLPTLTCINTYGNTVIGSGPAITAQPPPPIQFSASPTNGLPPPMSVKFNSPAVDGASNTIVSWNWNFGDGSNSVSPVENPTHTYTNSGTYFPTLTCSNNYGDRIAGYGPVIVVPNSLLLNGGFETGTFTNWTLSGVTADSHVTTSSTYVHSGKYGAELAAPATAGMFGFLSQTLSTTPGTGYLISFWLDNFLSITPNDFQVSWNGNVLLDETNIGSLGWTNIQLTVAATATSSTLQFGYLNSYLFGLDDIIVTPVTNPNIASISLSGTNLVLNGINGVSGTTNYLLMGTNLAQPVSQWTRIATNMLGASGNFTITATNAVDSKAPKRFYILQLQ